MGRLVLKDTDRFAVARVGWVLGVAFEEARRVPDSAERIPELVGEPAREQAKNREPFLANEVLLGGLEGSRALGHAAFELVVRETKRVLGADEPGDVMDDTDEMRDLARGVPKRRLGGREGVDLASCIREGLLLDDDRVPGAEHLEVFDAEKRGLIGRKIVRVCLAQHLLARKSHELLEGFVEEHPPKLLVLDENRVLDVIENGEETRPIQAFPRQNSAFQRRYAAPVPHDSFKVPRPRVVDNWTPTKETQLNA